MSISAVAAFAALVIAAAGGPGFARDEADCSNRQLKSGNKAEVSRAGMRMS